MIPYVSGHRVFLEADQGQAPSLDARLLDTLVAAAPGHHLSASAPVLAAELVAMMGLKGEAARAATVLVCVMLVDAQQGATRTPLRMSHLEARAGALLRGLPEGSKLVRDMQETLAELTASGTLVGPRRPIIRTGEWVTFERTHRAEVRLGERLAERLSAEDAELPLVELDGGITLSAEQSNAVRTATRRPLTLISGGPGTGKTSIVVALLRTLARLGMAPERMVLAAPTGKAAWRMGEAVRGGLAGLAEAVDVALSERLPAPATLHRTLGYSERTQRFARHAHDPLDADLVVVDESSMIDVHLMERLLAAVPPAARLVLLGDVDQLPSVAAGAVFRDVTAAAPHACARLTHSYRMRADDPDGSAILRVAERVRTGDQEVFGPDLVRVCQSTAALTHRGVELLPPDPLEHRAFLDYWFADIVAMLDLRTRAHRLEDTATLDRLFAHDNAARILCVTREGDGGATQANEELHARMARATRQNQAVPFLFGEPVMVQQNDYERGLFNGDHGLVLRVTEGEDTRPMVVFAGEGGYRAFHVEALAPRLRLGYAMTVHKAQGSEYDRVAIMLPSDEVPLMTRALLYTAVTRARRAVQFIGSPVLLRWGIGRYVDRFSGLGELLAR